MLQRTLGSLLVALLIAAGLIAAPAYADPPTDQPLPGYTISNPPLEPLVVNGMPTQVLQGPQERRLRHRSAAAMEWRARSVGARIPRPQHGAHGQSAWYGLRERFVQQGYAWAASSYYANGYDVRAGVLSTYDLARHFADVVGTPSRTYIAGDSMGGHVIGRSLEQYPSFYGALPMCGVLGDQRLF